MLGGKYFLFDSFLIRLFIVLFFDVASGVNSSLSGGWNLCDLYYVPVDADLSECQASKDSLAFLKI